MFHERDFIAFLVVIVQVSVKPPSNTTNGSIAYGTPPFRPNPNDCAFCCNCISNITVVLCD